jgi:hypothetical protein
VSVEFEPVPLGPRRRRVDPVVAGVLVVALGIGAAIVKPWDGEPADPEGVETPIAEATATADPAATFVPTRPDPGSFTSDLTWTRISPVVIPRDGLGVRAIVVDPQPDGHDGSIRRYAERWMAIGDGHVVVPDDGRPVVALGISVARGDVPLDVRIWRLAAGSDPAWLAPRPVEDVPNEGAYLFHPPATRGVSPPGWNPGDYRFDVLWWDRIERIVVTVPATGSDPDPTVPPDAPDLEAPGGVTDATTLPVGPFVTTARGPIPLVGTGGEALDEPAAWFDVDPGTGRRPGTRVARVHAPGATGLGVRLPAGSRTGTVAIRRLAPDADLDGQTRVRFGGAGPRQEPPSVVFYPPRGGVWPAGVYALDVAWREPDGDHEATWHIELEPGPARTPRLLRAVRDWARYAGRDGFVLGTAEPLEGGPRASTIRHVGGCDGPGVQGRVDVLGVTYPTDVGVRTVELRRIGEDGSESAVPIFAAPDAIPGLSVLTHARAPIFEPGRYSVQLDLGTHVEVRPLCLADSDSPDEDP